MIDGTKWLRYLAQNQLRLYQANLERNQLNLRLGLAERLHKDRQVVAAKYDGSSLKPLEERINTLFTQKDTFAKSVSQVTRALGRLEDIRIELLNMRAAAKAGDTATFDEGLKNLRHEVGSAVIDKGNLVGDPGGNWSSKSEVVGAGGFDVTLKSHFLGSSYAIDLDTGSTLRPDLAKQTLSGSGTTLNMADLTVVSRTGTTVEFSDGTTTYTGTLRTGGGEVLNSWLYNDFAAQGDRDEAMAAIDAAMKRISKVEREYRVGEALLTAGRDKVITEMATATKEHQVALDKEVNEKDAALKALQARMDLTEKIFALSGTTSATFIEGLFNREPVGGEKKSVLDIVGGF